MTRALNECKIKEKKGGFARTKVKKRGVTYGNKKDRLGETRMMNCGMKATIIRYENADDINICFEDGKVVEHKTYRAFKKGIETVLNNV